MREALEFHLSGMLEDGETIPEPTTTDVELKDEDFEDVEYFVIQKLEVKVPLHEQSGESFRAA
jgi:hypothetical protein